MGTLSLATQLKSTQPRSHFTLKLLETSSNGT
jgi:hypothetical protein